MYVCRHQLPPHASPLNPPTFPHPSTPHAYMPPMQSFSHSLPSHSVKHNPPSHRTCPCLHITLLVSLPDSTRPLRPHGTTQIGSAASADACLKGDVGARATKLCKVCKSTLVPLEGFVYGCLRRGCGFGRCGPLICVVVSWLGLVIVVVSLSDRSFPHRRRAAGVLERSSSTSISSSID